MGLKGENEWVTMEIRGHYFYVCYKKTSKTLNIKAAQFILDDAAKLAGDKVYPVLSDIKDMPTHGKEVRDFFASQTRDITIANAILVTSSINRIIANFFLTLNKPEIPTRIFTDTAKASKWLEMFPMKARPVLV